MADFNMHKVEYTDGSFGIHIDSDHPFIAEEIISCQNKELFEKKARLISSKIFSTCIKNARRNAEFAKGLNSSGGYSVNRDFSLPDPEDAQKFTILSDMHGKPTTLNQDEHKPDDNAGQCMTDEGAADDTADIIDV